MKYLPYILKHLRRNWIRTGSTMLGVAVCIFLMCTLQTFLSAINFALQSASAERLWTRNAVSLIFPLPLSYKPRIAAVRGVRRVAVDAWFGGIYKDPKNFFANYAVEADTFLEMYPEMQLAPEERAAFMGDRRGAVVGRDLATKYGWRIGDVVQLESSIPIYRVGRPFDFLIRGIYDVDRAKHPGTDRSAFFFHFENLYEATNRRIEAGTFIVEIDDASEAAAISQAIDALFENSSAQTRTETEGAFIAGFISLAGNLTLLLQSIGLAVTFTILLVTANTMSMAVRERRTEIAVLKTLGFSSALILGLILAESTMLAVMGGGLGIVLGLVAIRGLANAPMLGPVLAGYPGLGFSPGISMMAMALSVGLGAAAGIVPASLAFRSRVTEILRQV